MGCVEEKNVVKEKNVDVIIYVLRIIVFQFNYSYVIVNCQATRKVMLHIHP